MKGHASEAQKNSLGRLTNGSQFKASLRTFAVLAFAWAVFVTGLLTIGSVRLHAQMNAATLNGTVTDASGAVVQGATVTVTDTATNVEHVTKANDVGYYSVPSLTPGTYSITVFKAGFTVAKEPDITLHVQQIATLNISLAVGSEKVTVEVSTSAAALETTDASLGSVLSEQEVQDLPLNGRQFTELLQLSPGTVPIDTSQNAGKAPGFGAGAVSPSIDGQPNRSNIFFLDGIIASNPFFGGFSFSPSIDAIQEFKAQSHTDQAEYGQASGAIVSVVSRSGTNLIHGAAYEFVRNTIFDAKGKFDPKKLPYHQNQYGASFGGPIIKNKLFFYANYEGGRQVIGQSSNNSTVPTDDERSGNFTGILPGGVTATIYDPATYNPITQTELTLTQEYGSNQIPSGRIDKQMVAYLNGIYPKANQTPNALGENNYLGTIPNTTKNDQGSVRVDYNIGAKDSLNGRYSQNHAELASGAGLANIFATGFTGKNTGGTWVHTFSPTLISELTGGYNALNIPQGIITPVDQSTLFSAAGLSAGWNLYPGGSPVPQVPGYGLTSGIGAGYTGYWNGAGPIGPMHIAQGGGTITKIAGVHTLKLGASFYHTWMYTNWSGNNANFSYTGTWNAACQFVQNSDGSVNTDAQNNCPTYDPFDKVAPAGKTTSLTVAAQGDPVASMLLSVPNSATRYIGNDGVNLIESTPEFFFQDSWKVNRKLTITYGLRWDYSAPMREKNNRLTTYDIANQTYDVAAGDADLPSGPLPAHVVVLDRHSILTPHYLDFSPRLGFAYQITSTTTLRAGAGRTFDDWGLPLQIGQQARGAWPSGLAQQARTLNGSTTINSAGLTKNPAGGLLTGENPFYGTPTLAGTSPLPAGGLGFQPSDWVPADSFQWNLEVQQDFRHIGSLSLAYVGSHTSHATISQPYDTAPASTTPFASIAASQLPDPVYASVGTYLPSSAFSNYESFQVKLIRAFANGLTYNAGFTWSKDLALSACKGDYNQICTQNLYNTNKASGDYGPTYLDVPYVFTFNATYKLPFGKGEQFVNSGPAAYIVGNWQINTLLSIRSGLVIDPNNGQNSDVANAGGGLQRVSFTGNPNTGAPHKLTNWFNASAFAYPINGTFGNAGINSLRGPGYWNDDFSLFRDIPVTERFKAQLRFEAFDIFNHPNLGQPNGSFGSGGFNSITSTVSANGPGAQRDIQFALKLLF